MFGVRGLLPVVNIVLRISSRSFVGGFFGSSIDYTASLTQRTPFISPSIGFVDIPHTYTAHTSLTLLYPVEDTRRTQWQRISAYEDHWGSASASSS